MCGIAGIVAYHYAALDVDRDELRRMRDHMAARGPDGSGEWFSSDGRVGLGHRRLAIIDLHERAAQPMISQHGDLTIVFNGEIYNYQALRQELEAKGRVFRTTSDTEVLLHLYADRGEEMVKDLRGMFAFGLWDGHKKSLLLARDPYGIKPLYYADDGWTFRFASQVKALLAGGKVSRDPDPAGHVGFYLFGSVPEPYTMYQDIRAVPAGAIMWVGEVGPLEPKPYFSLARVYAEAHAAPLNLNERDLREYAREAFLDSVRHHLVADVPVGAFLSASVDSGSLVGLMRDAGQSDVRTVTLTFSEFAGKPNDEGPLAEQIAKQYGTHHTTRIVTESEFREDLPRILNAMDQPSIDGINTWFVSKAARELGLKAVVSGLGGDVLLGDSSACVKIPSLARRIAFSPRVSMMGRLANIVGLRMFPSAFRDAPKTFSALEYGGTYAGAYLLGRGLFMPDELDQVLERNMVKEGLRRLQPLRHISKILVPDPGSAAGRVAVMEAGLYMRNQLLRDTDWAGMAHSLEIRTPLVDSHLVKRLSPALITGTAVRGKDLLAQSLRLPIPEVIRKRGKTGFSTPVMQWIAKDPSVWKRNQLVMGASEEESVQWTRRWAQIVASAR